MKRKCPYCIELIDERATVCPHCQSPIYSQEYYDAVERSNEFSASILKNFWWIMLGVVIVVSLLLFAYG